jgi:hypothetical protein
MFWKSALLGLQTLADWHIWVAGLGAPGRFGFSAFGWLQINQIFDPLAVENLVTT